MIGLILEPLMLLWMYVAIVINVTAFIAHALVVLSVVEVSIVWMAWSSLVIIEAISHFVRLEYA